MTMLYAEWLKLRTARSTPWLAIAIVALTVGLSAFVCSAVDTDGGYPGAPGLDEDVVLNSLSGVVLGQVAAVALGVLAITSEYTTGLMRMTFTVFPKRRAVLAVKAIIVAACAVATGLVATVAAFLAGQPILHGNGFVYAKGYPLVSLTDPQALRAVVGSALYLGLIALFGFGVGALLKHTAAAMTTVLGLLFIPFMVALSMPDGVREPLQKAAPMTAGLAIQRTVLRADSVPIGEWAGLGVLAIWTAAAILAAFWIIGRRDA